MDITYGIPITLTCKITLTCYCSLSAILTPKKTEANRVRLLEQSQARPKSLSRVRAKSIYLWFQVSVSMLAVGLPQ